MRSFLRTTMTLLTVALIAAGGVPRADPAHDSETTVRACDRDRCWPVTASRAKLGAFSDAVLSDDPVALARLLDDGLPPGLESLWYGEREDELEPISPMIFAAQRGHEDVLRLYLDRGGNPDLRFRGDSSTLLVLAAYRGHPGVVALLLERGADVLARDRSGRDALGYAAQEGHVAVIRALLQNGANVNARDHDGISPLMIAARNGHEGAVQALLASPEIQVNLEDYRRRTALDVAKKRRCRDLLKQAGAKKSKGS